MDEGITVFTMDLAVGDGMEMCHKILFSKATIAMKRVFPNGTGFVAILALLLGWAWIDPKAAVSGGPVITGLFANFLIVMIFFLQGWRLRPARMFEVWADGYTLWITQIAIIATPVALVLSGWAVGVISEEKLSPFLLLACLPTTISSCVVYARGAGGDGDYALGHATLSNLLAPFLVPLAWFFLIRPSGPAHFPMTSALMEVVPNMLLLVGLPCFFGWWFRKAVTPKLKPLAEWLAGNLPLVGIALLAYFSLGQALILHGREQCRAEAVELLLPLGGGFLLLSFFSWFLSGLIRRDRGGRVATFFCLSQKSLALGIPMVHLLVGSNDAELFKWVFPVILLHFIQLVLGALIMLLLRR